MRMIPAFQWPRSAWRLKPNVVAQGDGTRAFRCLLWPALLMAATAQAATNWITIQEASFEIAASSTNYPVSGGTTWNGGGSFTPTAGMFTDPIPDGTHVGWWNNSDVFYQNFTNTLSAGTYTLTLWQGKRTDLGSVGYTPADSDFNLAAGGTTLTPSGSSIPTVAVGQWRQASKTYTIATNAANLNQTLQIRCTSFGSGQRHADIDNVSLGFVALVQSTSTLTVYSAYAGAVPPVGTNSLVSSNTYACAVTNSPLPIGTTTQYVCTGWTMTGNQPTNGSGTNFSLTITNNATLTWLWGVTNYLLTVSTTGTGSGSVTPGTGWYGAGSNVVLTASSNGGSVFAGWSGDTNGCGFAGNVLTAGMSRARAIAAQFTMPPSGIGTTPSGLAFTGTWYSTPAVQMLTISNTGSGWMAYALSNSAFWISESVTTGLLVGGSATTHVVRVTTRGLLPRTYAGAITIVAATATNGPVTVPVTLTVPAAPTPTIVSAWGDNSLGQTNVPAGLNNVTAIANGWGNDDCVALRADGTVAAWGGNAFGQTSVPANATNVVAVSSAYEYSLALRQNGTVVGWGTNSAGECTAPANLTNAVAISAGYWHSLAVRADGTVAAWGTNYTGECNVPASLSNAVSVASGYQISLALRADGTVMAWGGNGYFFGATNSVTTALGGITNAVAVSCGTSHALVLKADGTIVGFGRDAETQIDVPATATNVVAIGTGNSHSLAVRADGAVVGWGYNSNGQTVPPTGLAATVMTSGGYKHSWALSLAQNLVVASPWGTPTPAAGTSIVVRGAAQTCTVDSVVTQGTTQYVCAGWTGTGSAPASGTTNTVSFTITNDTAVSWAWTTNFWLAVTTNGPGTIAPSNATGWCASGSNVTLTATAATNGLFTGWAGDTNGCGIAGNVLTAPMTRARQIQAQFGGAVNLTVVSTYGGANPPAGTNALLNGSTCGCSVTNSPVLLGPGTQYVCTGWTMTGNQPTGGAGTNFSLTITNNAALTWTWTAVQTQAIAFAAIPDQLVTNGVGLAATASSGLAVSFAVGSGPATLTGGTNLTFTGAGTVAVVASQSGNALWFAAPAVTNFINVLKVPQIITFPSPGAQYVTNTLALAATANSGLPVSFAVVSGPATLSGGSNLTFTATGAVSVAASQAGNGTWAAATSITNTFNVLKVPQIISFTPPGAQFTTNTLVLAATASSGLPVSFAVVSGPATLSGGSNLTFTATGAVSVAASQTGSVTWAAAAGVTNTFNVLAAAQTISFTPPGAQYVTNTLVLAATASSGLPVSFAVVAGPATLSGGSNLTFTATGAVSVAASQTGSVIWAAATSVTNTFSVLKVPQTITFTPPGTQYATNTLKLAATASSGLPVSFAVVSGPATLSGGSNLTFTATGAVSVAASQTGSVTWAAAPSITNTFNVLAAAQTISFTPPGAQYVTNTLVLAATASSGLPVSFAVVAGPATLIGGSNLTFTATGAVSVAASQTGSVVWAAATSITNTFNVLRALQTVTFPPFGTQFTTNTLKLAATASSGLPVSFAVVSGPATLSGGSNLTFTAAGTVAVSASQAGSVTWAPATSVTNTFSVVQAAQTISFPNPGPQCVTNTLVLAATASSGLPVTFTLVSGPAVLAGGNTLTFTAAGTVAVAASQPGDAVWAAAPGVTNTFDISRAPYTWTLIPSNGPFAGGNLVLVTNLTTRIGSGSDITNVLVGGVMATVTNQGTNWVVIGMPLTGSAGLKDVVVQSTSVGATILSSAYTVNPPGQVGGVVKDWTQWQEVAGLPAPREYLAAGVMNGMLYAIGGADYNWDAKPNVYQYAGANWTEAAALPTERGALAAGTLNGMLYAIGGGNLNGFGQTNVYRYNGTNWSEVAGLPAPRMMLAAGVLNSALYAFGGYADSGWLTNMFRYDGTNWMEVASLPAVRYGMAAGVLNGALYVAGGYAVSGTTNNVYRYDGTNWTEVAGMPAPREEAAAGVLNGALYVVGGYGDSGIATNVYRYDGTNWTEVAGLPAPRMDLAVGMLNDELYACGGSGSGNTATNVYRYPTIVSTDFGVHPSSGAYQGGYPVVITGTNLGNGADITNVTLCGLAAAAIVSQSATQVTIIAAASGVGCLGDVAVYSTSYGLTVKSNAFTYTVPGIAILGTNGAVVANGEAASAAKGGDFGHLLVGASATVTLIVTNTGAAALTISGWLTNSANAAAFTVAGLPATLAAGAGQSFTVGCAPTLAGTFQAALVIANDATNYTVNLRAAAFALSAAFGPLAGGNALTITNGLLGSGSDITNVLVGGVRATIVAQGANWVTLLAPATGVTGLKDIVVQSTSVGTVVLPGAYTVNPAGQIGSVTEPAQWQKVASLPQGRCGLGAATLSNALYVMGGFGDDSNYTPKPNTYRFDGTNWTEVSPMPAAGGGYTAADTLNGVIYATGGNSYPFTNMFRYNGASWTPVPGWPASRSEPSLAALNGSLYLAGGATVANYVMATNVYRLNGTSWTEVASLPRAGRDPASAVLNGAWYIIGGGDYGANVAYTNVYRFDGTNWTEVAPLPVPRTYLSAAVLNGALYVFGGTDCISGGGERAFRFDGNTWTEVASLPVDAGSIAGGTLNGSLYAMGGYNGQTIPDVYRYYVAIDPGVAPGSGSCGGGYPVVITGTNLGSGSDVTNVTLCGVPVTAILSQSATQITVTAGAATPGRLGDVAVYSTSYGVTAKGNAFTYIGPGIAVLGTNGAVVPSGAAATRSTGTDFGLVTTGQSLTNILSVSNSGTALLTISGWTTNGADAASFAIAGLPATLAAGATQCFTICYAPTHAGTQTAALLIANDATNVAVNLSGSAVLPPPVTVQIVSAYGTTVPPVGIWTGTPPWVLTNQVANPAGAGGTQFVASGWVVAGNDPASGAGTNFVMTVTNQAVVTWLWATNYWLATLNTGAGGGSVTPGSGWCALGSNVTLTATAAKNSSFAGWTGDTNGCGISSNVLIAPMTQARTIAGRFDVIQTPAFIGVAPSAMAFSSLVYAAVAPQLLTITNLGTTAMTCTVASSVFWLSADDVGTVAPGAGKSCMIRVSTRGLAPRTYAGRLTISAPGATNSPATVAVRLTVGAVNPPTVITAWGLDDYGETDVPAGLTNAVAVAGGGFYSLALRADGTVVAWGEDYGGVSDVPPDLANVVAVAGGGAHALALRADGTVAAWGYDEELQTDVPQDLTNAVAVAGGGQYSLALRADGRVAVWGGLGWTGIADQPAGLTNAVAIAAGGGGQSLVLRADGSVVAWGNDYYGQADVPRDLTNAVAVAAGGYHSLALRADGTVVAWGYDAEGETDVPTNLSNVVAVAAGEAHSLALRADGTVVVWGDDSYHQTDMPTGITNAVAITTEGYHSMALIPASQLVVSSPYGSSFPGIGTNWLPRSSLQNCTVTSPLTVGLTQYVCTGWTGTGSVPASGTGTSVSFVLTNDSTLTWTWNWHLLQSQTISFPSIGNQVITNHVQLSATASSGLPVLFAVLSGPAQVDNGSNLTFTGTGTVAVVASQPGDTVWVPAPPVTNWFAVAAAPVTVQIVSAHGTTVPPVGIWTGTPPWVLTNQVANPDSVGGTQFVATGWVVAGNDPASGAGTNFVMTVTNQAVVTWLWATNMQFVCATGTNGTVTGNTNGWYAAGSSVTMTATPNGFYHFACWTGDVSTGQAQANPLTLLLDQPRWIAAVFPATVGTNYSTPFSWLASHGYTQDMGSAELLVGSNGLPLWQSYVADLNPTNAASTFVILSCTNGSGDRLLGPGNMMSLSFIGSTGRLYSLLYKTNLPNTIAWGTVSGQSNIRGNGGPTTLSDTNGAVSRFYRIRVSTQPLP